MKRTRLLLIATGVLVATLPVLIGARKPEIEGNCAPGNLSIDFWQVRNAVVAGTGKTEPGPFERFPFSTGKVEVLGASLNGGTPFFEMLALVTLEGVGENGVYLASLTTSGREGWHLTEWKHSTNLARFAQRPSEDELSEAVRRSAFEPTRICSKTLKSAVLAKTRNQPKACDPTQTKCADSTEQGHKVFLRSGCPTCHSTDGSSRVGPSLTKLIGRTVTFADGSQMRRDRAYLRQSILDPSARIVNGFNPAMTSFRERLDDTELAELLYYLESL